MGMYKYIKQAWSKPREILGDKYRAYLVQWRREPVSLRIERPTRLDKARSLGYKAKQGFILVRQKVARGGHDRPDRAGGRHSSNTSRSMNLALNYQTVAERRANDAFPNCEVINSYLVGKDGRSAWYEVILVDPMSPVIKADPRLRWVSEAQHKGRAYRGLTSSSRKTRGLRYHGQGTEHMR